MKPIIAIAPALVLALSGCAPIPQRPDLPSYQALHTQTAVLVNRMYYITLPEIRR
jgi:hypothetical protein